MENSKRLPKRSSKRLQSANIGVEECDNLFKSKMTGKRTRRSLPSPMPSIADPQHDDDNIQDLGLDDPTFPDVEHEVNCSQNNDEHEGNLTQNNEENPKPKRNKRGKTQLKGLGVRDTHRAAVDVEFNEKGQPICDNSITLSSFIGALVRDKVPILFDDWRKVPMDHKENLWTLVLLRYNLDETQKDYVMQKMATCLREYRSRIGNGVIEALNLEDEEKEVSLVGLKPLNLSDYQWSEFIKKRTSAKFQRRGDKSPRWRESSEDEETLISRMFSLVGGSELAVEESCPLMHM